MHLIVYAIYCTEIQNEKKLHGAQPELFFVEVIID